MDPSFSLLTVCRLEGIHYFSDVETLGCSWRPVLMEQVIHCGLSLKKGQAAMSVFYGFPVG